MKIYYEDVFVLNFLLDSMILYGTKRILKINSSNIRLILGGLFGSCTTFLLFIEIGEGDLLLIKLLMSIGIIYISFGKNNFIQNISYFYILSIILGGCFYLFDITKYYQITYLLLIILSYIIIKVLIKEFYKYKEKIINKYHVKIFYNKKWYYLEGFIDTGNQLVSPIKKESVILIHLKIPCKKIIYVPYKALNTSGVIPCFRPDLVLINEKEFKNCLVGIANDKINASGCSCILPNKFKEELC